MFSGRKVEKPRKARRGGNLAQLGLMDVPDLDDPSDGEGDAALEAELLALTGGGGGGRRPPNKKGKDVVSPEELARMVSDCMRDDFDDNEEVDEEDSDLLAELSALNQEENGESRESTPSRPAPEVPTKPASDYRNPEPILPRQAPMAAGKSVMDLLAERISMYEQAEANAKASGETSRVRRFNRGLKTLQQMQKSVKAGNAINEDDIPPPVLVRGVERSHRDEPQSQSSTPAAPSPSEDRSPSHKAGVPASIPQNLAFGEQNEPVPEPRANAKKEPQGPPSGPHSARQPSQGVEPPPPLCRTSSTSSTTPSASGPVATIRQLHTQYKVAALAAKKAGDKDQALQYMRIMKQMEPMLHAAESGQPVDLTTLPRPPGEAPPSMQPPRETLSETSPPAQQTLVGHASESAEAVADAGGGGEPAPGAPPRPATVLEALEQRLAKYAEQRDKAKAEENARKERMNQRIMKQYEDAIKKHKAGKPVDFDELPTPPGFAPIPIGGGSAAAPPLAPPPAPAVGEDGVGGPSPNKQPRQGPAPVPNQTPPSVAPKPAAPPKNVRQAPQSRVEKQLAFLTRRQTQFKQAALEAKKRGEIEQAKEYLRMSKGFDQLIEATRNGLPVDMNTVPVPPQEKIPQSSSTDFELVSADDCVVAPEGTSGDVALIYTKLEEDLIAQIKMCAETREHFKATGDVASSNRFEQLILHTKKDLDAVRAAFKRGSTPPRFHYETRSFNIIQCNTDLNDSDCEVNILRGINFNVQNPKDVDTYVRVEFPYPSDNPPQDRSGTVKDTNNPEYNHKTVFSIDRKSRALARVFKRHAIKLQVFTKGSWFHRDTLLGLIKVPLVTLETKCSLHDSFDLMDERKRMVGGKLEVKIRLRNPIVAKQLEKVTEKWLVIDGF